MRKLNYLSPTSLALWESNRETFYLEYLCEKRKKRDPQTGPMSVGSAFDAYAKSYLHEKTVGRDPKFEFTTLFEAQVEPHNRDQALIDGKIVWDLYQKHGGLLDVLKDLEGCLGKPKFETSIEGYVECVSKGIGAVPMLGKPDIYFLTINGVRIIFDWKVTGFYAKTNYSPKRGYIRCLPDRNAHKDAFPMDHEGYRINVKETLDSVEKKWATQLSIYAWLLGNEVGSKFVVAIDEICCTKDWMGSRDIRIAQHRALVNVDFQYDLFKRAHAAWYGIQSEYIFDEMSKETSMARCEALDAQMEMRYGPVTDEDKLFDSLCE
jgi:hypothetical protein